MRDYVKVPPAQNGPTVGLPYGKPDNTQPPKFHTPSSRDYAPIVDNYPEASGLLQGLSRTAQRFAGALAVERGVEVIAEEHLHPGGLGSPADHLRNSEGPTGEFMRRETSGREWFDKIADRSRPGTGMAPNAVPARGAYQPALNDNLPQPRPRMYRGAEAISPQDALNAGPAGVDRSAPIQATYKRPEMLALGPGPSAPAEPTIRPQTRTQRRSGKQSETLGGVDWSKY